MCTCFGRVVAQIFFKQRVLDEEGYILSVRKNGLLVLIPKYGLEGTVYLSKPRQQSLFVFDEKVRELLQTVTYRNKNSKWAVRRVGGRGLGQGSGLGIIIGLKARVKCVEW